MIKVFAFIITLVIIIVAGCGLARNKDCKQSIQLSQNTNVKNGLKSKDAKYEINGIVARVKDGDTLVFKTEKGERFNVRLYGVDTPEKDQPYGPQATGYLKKMVDGKAVSLKVYGTDRSKRLLAKVYYNNKDINAELVRIGAAWHYKFFDKSNDYDFYACLEDNAKNRKLGLWNKQNPIPPWEFRKAKKNKKQQNSGTK